MCCLLTWQPAIPNPFPVQCTLSGLVAPVRYWCGEYSQISWAYTRWMCRVAESTFEVGDYHNLSAGLLTNDISYVACQVVIWQKFPLVPALSHLSAIPAPCYLLSVASTAFVGPQNYADIGLKWTFFNGFSFLGRSIPQCSSLYGPRFRSTAAIFLLVRFGNVPNPPPCCWVILDIGYSPQESMLEVFSAVISSPI